MRINKLLLLGLIAITGSTTVPAAEETNQVSIQAETDRPDAIYKCGENTVFTVAVKNAQDQLIKNGTVKAALTLDGLKQLSDSMVDLRENNPFTVSGTLETPGFLQLTCSFKNEDKTIIEHAAAGYDPLAITPAMPEPKDFDAFWTDAVKQLEKQPLGLELQLIEESSNATQNTYRVSFANINSTRIYGFLSIPKGAGSFPAIVMVPGAGPGSNSPSGVSGWGSQGVIALYMNVHSYSPYISTEALQKKYDTLNEFKTYPLQGAPDRDQYFFKKSILGINRAINYVASRPEFDQKHFVISGSSQGGAHALILAGLNTNLTASSANVPALCDHGGYLKGRKPGWPGLVTNYNKAPECLEMSGYFDAVNFARRITVPTVIGVGFIDRTCSPSSVYAAYNVINTPKQIITDPKMGHSFSKAFIQFSGEWIRAQLGLIEQIAP